MNTTAPLYPELPEMSTLLKAEHESSLVRSVFSVFPTGVAAVSAEDGDSGPAILLVSSFQVGISMEPPLVLFAVQKSSTSWPRIRTSKRIGISILSSIHSDVARSLSKKGVDRFAGIRTLTSPGGAIFVRGACAWLEASVYNETPAGDHTVVLLEVHGVGVKEEREPLVWLNSRFRLIAGQT